MNGFERTGELLAKLSEVGQPHLWRNSLGGEDYWLALVKFPAPDGVTAEVKGERSHSPDMALQTCIDRLGGLRSMLSVPSPQIGAVHEVIA